MRTCFAIFVAVLLSLNAASAAVVSVFDALEHTQIDASQFGHHSHQQSDNDAHDGTSNDPDGTANAPAAIDHHHAHAPGFSTILPSIVGMIPLDGRSPLVPTAVNPFVSTPQVRIDRPPRALLA